MVALLAALGLVAACTGRGRHQPVQAATRPAGATAQAKEASATLVRLAGTIGSWQLDPAVRSQLRGQIGYAVNALEHGNWLGARTLLAAWKSNARALADVGVLPRPDGSKYQDLAAAAARQLPARGRVQPFTQSDAPPLPSACSAGGLTWLDFLRTTAIGALGGISYVGALLGGYLGLLWPSSQDLKENRVDQWQCLATQLGKIVHLEIVNHVREDLGYKLDALERLTRRYVTEVEGAGNLQDASPGTRELIKKDWEDLSSELFKDYDAFARVRSSEPWAFLPEFAPYMNLYLATLRDGVLYGQQFGLSPEQIQRARNEFTQYLGKAESHVDKEYAAGHAYVTNPAHISYRMEKATTVPTAKAEKAAPYIDEFNAGADYDVFMTPAVKDQQFNWTYMNPVEYPGEVRVPPDTRVIFSPAAGSGAKGYKYPSTGTGNGTGLVGTPTGAIKPPMPPDEPITSVTAWTDCTRKKVGGTPPPICPSSPSEAWVRGWRVHYGPQVSRTYGYTTGTENGLPLFGNPITSVEGVAGLNSNNPIINSIEFMRRGEVARTFGNPQPEVRGKNAKYSYDYPGEVLAGVYSGGNFPGSTRNAHGCYLRGGGLGWHCDWEDETTWQAPSSVVFAFRLADSYAPPPPEPTSSFVAYVTNAAQHSVSVIDTADNKKTGTIEVGREPGGVAVAPDGRHVYTANFGTDNVSVIDSEREFNHVAATIPVHAGPEDVAVAPDGNRVYVTSSISGGKLSVIDPADNKVVATLHPGFQPHGVAVTPDSHHVYVANYMSNTVSVIDATDNEVVKTVSGIYQPYSVAVAPNGGHVYVTHGGGKVAVIDTSSNTVTKTIDLGYGNSPEGVAVTPDGQVYVAGGNSGKVSVIDPADNTVVKNIDVGGSPSAVAVTPDGNHVYVTTGGGKVAVIDTADNSVTATFDVGGRAAGIAVSPRPFGQPAVPDSYHVSPQLQGGGST